MDWVSAHLNGIVLAVGIFAALFAAIAFFFKVEPGLRVTPRVATLIVAVMAVVSIGFGSLVPVTPTAEPEASGAVSATSSPASSALVSVANSATGLPSASGSRSITRERQWLHNPPLHTPVGLPGLIKTVLSSSKDGDPSETLLELSLDEDEILVISGNWAKFPNPGVGTVGLKTNCYMVIARGPMTWTNSPSAGEFSPISLPPTTMAGWHVDRVDAMAETHVWTDEWVASLAKAGVDKGPCSKGADPQVHSYPSVDLWELP